MSLIAVALDGDTRAEASPRTTPGTSPDAQKWSGKWTVTDLQVTQGDYVRSGRAVELTATATFTYVGTDNAGFGHTVTETVSLEAKPTVLTDRGRSVLLDGDEVSGEIDDGNRVRVQTREARLRTQRRL